MRAAPIRVLKDAYPAGPSTAELATYRVVDKVIAKEAARMCAERCAKAAGGKPCRGCNAVVHGWRDDAIGSLKAAARLREAQAGAELLTTVTTVQLPAPGPSEARYLVRSSVTTQAAGVVE